MLSLPPPSTRPGDRTVDLSMAEDRGKGNICKVLGREMLNDLLTQWLLAALKTNVRQQVGFDGGLGSLQDPPHNQVNHTGGCSHQINHLCVAHVAHICGVHLISR